MLRDGILTMPDAGTLCERFLHPEHVSHGVLVLALPHAPRLRLSSVHDCPHHVGAEDDWSVSHHTTRRSGRFASQVSTAMRLQRGILPSRCCAHPCLPAEWQQVLELPALPAQTARSHPIVNRCARQSKLLSELRHVDQDVFHAIPRGRLTA